MLERVYEQRQALLMYTTEYDIQALNSYSYNLMGDIIRAIKPFEDPRFKEKFLKDKEHVMEMIITELIADDETDQFEDQVELSQEKEQNSDISLEEEIHMDFWSGFNELKEDNDGDDPDTPSGAR